MFPSDHPAPNTGRGNGLAWWVVYLLLSVLAIAGPIEANAQAVPEIELRPDDRVRIWAAGDRLRNPPTIYGTTVSLTERYLELSDLGQPAFTVDVEAIRRLQVQRGTIIRSGVGFLAGAAVGFAVGLGGGLALGDVPVTSLLGAVAGGAIGASAGSRITSPNWVDVQLPLDHNREWWTRQRPDPPQGDEPEP